MPLRIQLVVPLMLMVARGAKNLDLMAARGLASAHGNAKSGAADPKSKTLNNALPDGVIAELGSPLFRPPNGAGGVAISPDGTCIFTTGVEIVGNKDYGVLCH